MITMERRKGLYEQAKPHFYRPAVPDGFPAFKDLFARPAPLEFEIGCGRGKFILERAALHPERNFLAIDCAGKWLAKGQGKAKDRQLPNLLFLATEAWQFVEEYMPPQSVAICHIYFPDPWPKRKHEDRRLLQAAFFELLFSRLESNGKIELATDEANYFTQIRREAACLEGRAEIRESRNQRLFGAIKTNFEVKYEAEGRALYYLEIGRK